MKLLIVCATQKEGDFLSAYMSQGFNAEAPVNFHHYKNLEFTLLITGVGMVATCYFLQKELSKCKYDFAINIGIAGCFKSEIPLGTVFNVKSDCFSESGAEEDENFISVFDLGLQNPGQFPFENGGLKPKQSLAGKVIHKLPNADSITVNKAHGNERSINEVRKAFHPDLETMEGAAFFYVCMMESMPCIQLRAVSNLVEKRNRNAWNIPLALENLKKILLSLMDELAENNKKDFIKPDTI